MILIAHRLRSEASAARNLFQPTADGDVPQHFSDALKPRSDTDPSALNLCDPRLKDLDIGFWTGVEISNEHASHIISLYLQTDHPLLAPFDADAFVADLVAQREDYCSAILVNALLYWSCVRIPIFLT